MPKKLILGTVISDKMDKTVTVEFKDLVKHPVYKKTIKRTKKYHAHDESNECKIGDIVEIEESKPVAKTVRYTVVRIVKKIDSELGTPEEVEGGEF
ncbi:MAG TPA: 30S ribosomal protein S17 [Tepiditoga sp.]|nr:30S ribosomal protein S17 [Thermotogota bacterium]HOO74041.1 30S ribosomal protein S17 [Tepiditoga sp.]